MKQPSFATISRWVVRVLSINTLLLGLLMTMSLPLAGSTVQAAPRAQAEERVIYRLSFQGAVTPVLEKYIEDSIAAATENPAVEAIILELDTPGGSVDITQSITQDMLASPVPIVVYVAPSGAHAGSAGTFITLAGHAAAMAPGSSIGAASPVGSGGQDVGETMEAKIVNILSADIENLAERRGEEAVEWAIAAVEEAAAATANRALELGVIDFIATDLPDLLEQLDGFEVTVRDEPYIIETENAFLEVRELNAVQRFLNLIANPSIATILITLGSAGLLAEVWNPGTWIPGIIGLFCLLLGLYALGQLDANFAGLGLMVLAIILFVAEVFTPTFGALTAGGIVVFIFGAALLFDAPGVDIPWPAIIVLAVGLGGFTFYAGSMGLAAQRRPSKTGGDGLIGQVATVKETFSAGQRGKVYVYGEWWNAELDHGTVTADERVRVTGREGYTLRVQPVGEVTVVES